MVAVPFSGNPVMNRLVAMAALAAALSSPALAFVPQTMGAVKSFDATTKTLILLDGSEFYVPENLSDPAVKAGATVQVIWTSQDGRNTASTVDVH
jgi:Protein of unknown function (DUF1344)